MRPAWLEPTAYGSGGEGFGDDVAAGKHVRSGKNEKVTLDSQRGVQRRDRDLATSRHPYRLKLAPPLANQPHKNLPS